MPRDLGRAFGRSSWSPRLIKELSPFYNRALAQDSHARAHYPQRNSRGVPFSRDGLSRRKCPSAQIPCLRFSARSAKRKSSCRPQRASITSARKCSASRNVRAECFQRQLGRCNGACVAFESPGAYNERFDAAFAERRIKTWALRRPGRREGRIRKPKKASPMSSTRGASCRSIRYSEDGIGGHRRS